MAGTLAVAPDGADGRAEARGDRAAFIFALATLVALRLLFMFGNAPIGDEAYYWLWGQHPDLSYFDHPPLTAWMQSISAALLGWNRFGLRFLAFMTTGVTIWLLSLWARQLAGAAWRRHFALSVLVFFASPLFFTFTAMVYPDQLLIALILASSYCFVRFFDSWDAAAPRWSLLFAAAALLGLAALAKYNAVFLAVGVGACVLLMPSKRGLLLKPQLYLAALLTLAIFSPVIVWNLQHGAASFKFNLVDRHAANYFHDGSLGNLVTFLLQNAIYVSVFLVWPVLRVLLGRVDGKLPGNAVALARAVFLISTAVMCFVALGSGAGAYWNIVAYLPMLPLLAALMGRAQLVFHAAAGIVIIAFYVLNGTVLPTSALSGRAAWEDAILFGWDQIGDEVRLAEGRYRPDFVAASRYSLAAQLAFARGRPDVTAISARSDQFDIWFDPAAHAGKSALLLTDAGQPLNDYIRGHFERIEEVASFEIDRLGYSLNHVRLYMAYGYRP